ncbi:MAG: PEP-CTERM sorting domain-containing protein, partial [Phycisphaerae bacterium]
WTNVTTFTGGSVAMFTPGKLSIGLIGSASSDGLPLMDNLQVQNVPEPATMILLSLGGLLLRRRK